MADPTHTLDDSTYASNPGGLRVNYFYWIRSFPSRPVQLILPLVILVGIAFLINRIFGLGLFEVLREGKSLHNLPSALLGIIIFNVFFWLGISRLINQLIFFVVRTREHFLYGCVNPGTVVSTKPFLVAVSTDLTTDRESHYAIKILPQPLQWMKHGVPPVGTRLATIALYEGFPQKGHWDNFHPVVVDCVTGNQADIKRVFRSIPESDWQELEVGLEYIQTTKPGLYPIPFIRCAFCHQLIFQSLYPSHREQHTKLLPDGQMIDHITIEPALRYQGDIDGVPQDYLHPHCNVVTRMPEEIIRSYLINPFLYSNYTFCCGCNDYSSQNELYWCETGQCLADYFQQLQNEYKRLHGEPPPSPFV